MKIKSLHLFIGLVLLDILLEILFFVFFNIKDYQIAIFMFHLFLIILVTLTIVWVVREYRLRKK